MRYCVNCTMPDTRPGIKRESVALVRIMKRERKLIGTKGGKNLKRFVINTEE